jgi:hypothetical protein
MPDVSATRAAAPSARVAGLLASARPLLNERFTRLGKGRAPDAFLRFLRETAVPMVEATTPEASGAVLFALFDAGLAGAERGLVGQEQQSAFEAGLVARSAALAPLLGGAPARVLRALGNGFHLLERALGAREARVWLAGLGGLAAHLPDADALEGAGLLLAWRLGLAEAREAALMRAGTLSAEVRATIVGAPSLDPDPARRFCAPGTSGPLGPLEVLATVGGFVGFGGPFARPPRVFIADGALLATDGDTAWRVFADVFGARLVRASAQSAAAAESAGDALVRSADDGALSVGEHAVRDARLAGATSIAALDHVAVVSLRQSHALWVLGRREARE